MYLCKGWRRNTFCLVIAWLKAGDLNVHAGTQEIYEIRFYISRLWLSHCRCSRSWSGLSVFWQVTWCCLGAAGAVGDWLSQTPPPHLTVPSSGSYIHHDSFGGFPFYCCPIEATGNGCSPIDAGWLISDHSPILGQHLNLIKSQFLVSHQFPLTIPIVYKQSNILTISHMKTLMHGRNSIKHQHHHQHHGSL